MLERLRILVDGNAQGAIREFEKLGAAADRELGKTDDRLQKLSAGLTNFGAGAVAGGAVAIGGLKMLADSASAYGEQVSAATVTFGEEGAAQLEKFAEAAADTANISKTEATKAANGFASFARQAGLTGTAATKFSTDLVQLAGDISSFRDISVEEALQALQSGLAGEGEPIRRLGGDISDVALKAEYLALTGQEVTGSLTQQQKVIAINSKLFKDFELAQGDVLRTQDSLANQTRNAAANFENLKTELGEGLVPVFATVVGGVNDIITKFGELPAGLKGPLATLAGIGAFGSVAVGALSLVAGQAIKFRDAFTTTTTTVVDGVETQKRALTGLGRTAVVVGKIGTALAVSEGIFQGLNAAGNATGALEDALNRTLIASENTGAGVLDAFSGLVNAEDRVLSLSKVITDNGTQIELGNDRLISSIEDTQAAFDKLKGADPAAAAATLDQLQIVTDGLDRNSGQYKANQEFIDRNRESLRLQAGAAEVAGGELNALDQELANVGEQTATTTTNVEGLKVATDEATNAFKAYSDLLRASTDPFFAAIDATNRYAEAQAKVAEAFAALADGATIEEIQALAEAQRNAVAAGIGLETSIADIRAQVEDGTISYQQALDTLDQLARKYPELAGAVATVKTEFFLAAVAAQGLQNEAPIDLPINVDTQQTIDKIGGVIAAIEAVRIAAEAVAATEFFARQVAQSENAANRSDIGFQEIVGNRDLNGNGIIGRRFGGPVDPRRLYRVGEAGPELFVPNMPGKIVPNDKLGGNTLNLTQNIQSSDPILTAAEVVRRQRDAEFLAGV